MLTQKIKNKALELGFNAVGVAKAEKLEAFEQNLNQWLNAGYQAGMNFMERNKEKRTDPTVLVPGAKSVISLLLSYYPEKEQPENIPQIAKYAYGTDYHFVIKDMMKELWNYIEEFFPELDGRIFVDSAPVPDKIWAVKAGLGWIGKNACLIHKDIGSFMFVSELIINLELDYDEPYHSNFCGSCTKCLTTCPTGAIVQPGVIDSKKCISYLTIENKDDTIPNKFKNQFGQRIFGCDTCQDVCPWNKNPLTTTIQEFKPGKHIFTLDVEAWRNMDKFTFNKLFKQSPLKRAKHKGLMRNVAYIAKKEPPSTPPQNE